MRGHGQPQRGVGRPGAIAIALIAVALAGAGVAQAQRGRATAPDIHFLDEYGNIQRGVRCATPVVGRAEQAAVTREVEEFVRRYGVVPPGDSIPVAFHVIYIRSGSSGKPTGHVPVRQLQEQIEVLNDSYEETGFRFHLASHDYTESRRWFYGCWGNEAAMKEALAIDPVTTLNIYTCRPGGNILGWSYLPWSLLQESPYHGVVALYSTLPGGTAAPYNEGDTITHEVGHYLGLYHTFQNGCSEPGDDIDDTPYEATPAFGCPFGRDTCSQPGLDPIHNFMDYTDDACMTEFTVDQADRMRTMVSLYKPGL